ARDRPPSAHWPVEPLQALPATSQIARQQPAGLLREVLKDRAGLEQRDRRTAGGGLVIDDRRDPVVRRDREKRRRELLAFADVDGLDRVRESRLLEEDRDLVPVW